MVKVTIEQKAKSAPSCCSKEDGDSWEMVPAWFYMRVESLGRLGLVDGGADEGNGGGVIDQSCIVSTPFDF